MIRFIIPVFWLSLSIICSRMCFETNDQTQLTFLIIGALANFIIGIIEFYRMIFD